jgi:pyrimidine and pyridine-specific 5'-nucleotidase
MVQAGVTDPSLCYFVDDQLKNVETAKTMGWNSSVWYNESKRRDQIPVAGSREPHVDAVIDSLEELRHIWAPLYKALPSNDRA